jgi:hypothetical protein
MEAHISDFCPEHYRDLLQIIVSNYSLATYSEQAYSPQSLILRHDLDLDLGAAVQIATIEAEMGIRANYFLLLRSQFYNPFEVSGYRQIQQIKALGHHIGIHLDIKFYEVQTEHDLVQALEIEKVIFEKAFGIEAKMFTFHLTSPLTMSFEADTYAGLANGYSKKFKSGFDYCSDSFGLWRYERLFDFLKRAHEKPLHVLTHPEWWAQSPAPAAQRLNNIISTISTKLRQDANANYVWKGVTNETV